MRIVHGLVVAAFVLAGAPPALAAPCKDPKTGRFIKCASAAPAKPKPCKDAMGKFAKCGTVGARPV